MSKQEFPHSLSKHGYMHVAAPNTCVYSLEMGGIEPNYTKCHFELGVTKTGNPEALATLSDRLDRIMSGHSDTLPTPSSRATPPTRKRTFLTICPHTDGGMYMSTLNLVKHISTPADNFLLLLESGAWFLFRVCDGGFELWDVHNRDIAWTLESNPSENDLSFLRRHIEDLDVRWIHLRHFIYFWPEILGTIQDMNVRTYFSIHDFYSVCPSYNLINGLGNYCNGNCDSQSAGAHDCTTPQHFGINGRLHDSYVHDWRRRIRNAFSFVDRFIVTSRSAEEVVRRTYPEIPSDSFFLIPHGRPRIRTEPYDPDFNSIVYIGNLGPHKGAEVLLKIADRFSTLKCPVHIHFFGTVHVNLPFPSEVCVFHGRFNFDCFDKIVAVKPFLSLIPSQWPETFSNTLTESWMLGIPVLASGIGALEERLAVNPGGWLVDDFKNADSWIGSIENIRSEPEKYNEVRNRIQAIPLVEISETTPAYERTFFQNEK